MISLTLMFGPRSPIAQTCPGASPARVARPEPKPYRRVMVPLGNMRVSMTGSSQTSRSKTTSGMSALLSMWWLIG